MNAPWLPYFLLGCICIIIQGFFAMMEMASVSFNKVRLQYYTAKKVKSAIWLTKLLRNPAYLFGTTLIMVNTMLQLGSEASRRFYDAIDLSPNFAPITQILVVLIFAELVPMFAGRRYAEHVVMLNFAIVYFVSLLLRPAIYLLDYFCRFLHWIFGSKVASGIYLTREEIQKALEEHVETRSAIGEAKELNRIVTNIFTLQPKSAKELMLPLNEAMLLSSDSTVDKLREILKEKYSPFIPIYHRSFNNIVAIAYPRDLLRLQGYRRVSDQARAPWFVTEETPVTQILKQFRHNNQSVAVVLNRTGVATGLLTLDEICEEIFGFSPNWIPYEPVPTKGPEVIVDRHIPGSLKVEAFAKQYEIELEAEKEETFEELVARILGHAPTKGESIKIGRFEIHVEEAPLIGEKVLAIKTIH
jgi:magnesium and cobalt exporter, CNNM family